MASDGPADGTDTEWEWRVYPKGKRYAKQGPSYPSVVVTTTGDIRFNTSALDVIGDDVEYVRYMVRDSGEPVVGFQQTDEDDTDGYSVSGQSSSLQSVLTSFGLAKPAESRMFELQTTDDGMPYVDLSKLPDADGASGGGDA